MRVETAVTELLLAKDYTPRTRARREQVLAEFMQWLAENGVTDLSDLARSHVRRYVQWLRERPNKRWNVTLAGDTQHTHASIVRMFLRFCAREDWIDERVAAHFDMPRRPQKVVQVLTHEHFMRLLRAADRGYLARLRLRDKAIISVLLDTGMRANELCQLTLDTLFITPNDSYVRVEGKGRKQREIGIGKQAVLAIHRYITRARQQSDYPNVFLSDDGRPMTPNAIDRMLYRLRDTAGREHFDGIRISAHTFRHTYACRYLEHGGDIYKLSRLLGHTSVVVTEGYLRAFQARDARRGMSVLDQMQSR